MKQIKIFQVDAFTRTPFKGNPAAVCVLEKELDVATMQSIAAENNLSETAFVIKQQNGFGLRWFSPLVEVSLCGHATLATAHTLWEQQILQDNEPAVFHTLSGVLTVTKKDDGWMDMDFPARENHKATLPDEVLKAVGVVPVDVVYSHDRYIIEVATVDEVVNTRPDFTVLKNYDRVVITTRGDGAPYDFVSRNFAPSVGVNEDPVTGSAHCCLAPYWAAKLNKQTFFAYQASARGGAMKLRLEKERVIISGVAVTIMRGTMIL